MMSGREYVGAELQDLLGPVFNMDPSRDDKTLIKDVFPMPDPSELRLTTRNWFYHTDRRTGEAGEINMRIEQGKKLLGWDTPTALIRDYFGEEIALYSDYVAYYTKWASPMAVVGVVTCFAQIIEGNNTIMTPLYCLIVAIWVELYIEGWKRHESSLRSVWNTEEFEKHEKDRPQFSGEVMLNQITGDYDRVMNPYKRYSQMALSVLVLFTFVSSAVVAMLAITILSNNTLKSSGFGGLLAGSLVNFAVIEVFNRFFKGIAFLLTDCENHQKDTQYYDHAIAKTCMFQFVNSYCPFFYTAFLEENVSLWGSTKGCPEDDCMYTLRVMLGTIFIGHILLLQVIEVLWPYVAWKMGMNIDIIHCSGCCFTRQTDEEILELQPKDFNSQEWVPLTAEEVEYAKKTYESPFDDYNELVIQFGFVYMFAAAFPLGSLLATINNMIEIRTDGFKICMLYRRPMYRCAQDIGTWLCLLYTSDAADEEDSVDLGGRRIIKKKKRKNKSQRKMNK
eukprot:TRINITY_DN23416_c0_g1_i1.p1 TRINITY_DN23416_c0_g1~~TRINITY_DN23416_c0_g1_i1.p1  ORF type:complete len:506 (+),score=109.23 TRINITY_DN23416_c0_g1_i1:282-1799(+)